MMKRMLIIHPHWPPSNTTGVHRVRLIANELEQLNWKAVVLTVDERDIEDELAPDLEQLVSDHVEVIKVRANPVRHLFGKRLIGDIGLRAWIPLRRKAQDLLASQSFQFIWFSVPSWYTPLMGPGLNRKFKVPFGVDYRDPWVYELANRQKGLNRATATVALARLLEPLALKNVGLISGVSDGYLEGVRRRYSFLSHANFLTFQMGFRRADHEVQLPNFTPPFAPKARTYIYAGAYSPNWQPLFSTWLKALAQLHNQAPLHGIEFLFVGTGNPELPSIQSQAEELGIQSIVREIPERQPYLEVQQMLRESDGALVIGSIEPHYSASKLFQCLVTAPRVFGFFHEASEGREILEACQADSYYVAYHPEKAHEQLQAELQSAILQFTDPSSHWEPDLAPLQQHTSANNAQKFIAAVEEAIGYI